jgi:flagellar basal body rod protein FlgB
MDMTSSVSSIGSVLPTLNSALQGFGTQAATAANNIANVDSTGYKALRANTVSMDPGMRAVVEPTNQGVDLGSQLVNLTTAKQSYQAAAAAMGSISRTEKKALDLIG